MPTWDKAQNAPKEKPIENLRPRRGMLVQLEGEPGTWQVIDHAPGVPGSWWLTAWDDAAHAAAPDPQWKYYRKATYRTMRQAGK